MQILADIIDDDLFLEIVSHGCHHTFEAFNTLET